MKHKQNKVWMLVTAILLLGLGACKMELKQEVWLNADDSGRARLEAKVIIPRLMEGDEENTTLNSDNALQEYADRVNADPGAALSLFETSTDHNPDEFKYVYELEFIFDDLQTLRNVVCIDSLKGFNRHEQGLAIDPRNFLMQQESEMQEYLSLMDINMHFSLHLPKLPAKVESSLPSTPAKDLSWDINLAEGWYDKPEVLINIQY